MRSTKSTEMNTQQSLEASTAVIKRFIKFLKKRMNDIREDREYWSNVSCTFCGRLDRECPEGGDHSSEMREIMRNSNRYW
jgi:hypothetical protein